MSTHETERLARVLYEADRRRMGLRPWPFEEENETMQQTWRGRAAEAIALGVTLAPTPAPVSPLEAAAEALLKHDDLPRKPHEVRPVRLREVAALAVQAFLDAVPDVDLGLMMANATVRETNTYKPSELRARLRALTEAP